MLALPNEPAQEGQLEVMVEWTPLSVGTKREAQRASEAAAHRCSRQVTLLPPLQMHVPCMQGEAALNHCEAMPWRNGKELGAHSFLVNMHKKTYEHEATRKLLVMQVDLLLRASKAVDLSKLLIGSEAVWVLYLDIYVLDADGSVLDACLLAAVAALASMKPLPSVALESGRVRRHLLLAGGSRSPRNDHAVIAF